MTIDIGPHGRLGAHFFIVDDGLNTAELERMQAYVSDPRLQALVIAGVEMRMLRLAVGVDNVIRPGAVNVPRHRPSGKHKAQWKREMNHDRGARR